MSDQAKAWAEAQAVSDPDAKNVLLSLAERHTGGAGAVRVDWVDLVSGADRGAVVKLVGGLHFLHMSGLIRLPCIADTMTITLLMGAERAGEVRR